MKKGAKILTLVLVLAMMFSILAVVTIPASAVSTAGSTLYLKPNSNWTQANARFAAYFMNSNKSTTKWVSMADSDGDGYYEVTIPTGSWKYVIFVRMNPANSTNDWNNKWNQTADLTIPTDSKNCFTLASGNWDSASTTWSTYTPTACKKDYNAYGKCTNTACKTCHFYTVTGNDAAVFGSSWAPATGKKMLYNSSTSTYTLVVEGVAAGEYKFKCIKDGDANWSGAVGGTGSNADTDGNYVLKVAYNNSTITITLKSGAVSATVDHVHTWVDADCDTPKTCSICNATDGEANGHSYEAVVTKPTCTVDGYTTYTCSCGDSYVDDKVEATGHKFENGVCGVCEAKDPDYCEHEFTYDCDKACNKCHNIVRDEANHTTVHVEAKAYTCDENGNVEYWYCESCGSAWLDEALTQQTNAMSVVIPAAHTYTYACDAHCSVCYELTNEDAAHSVIHVDAVAPTCKAGGNVEYWYCEYCGSTWLDEALTLITNQRSVKLGVADHVYTNGYCTCGAFDINDTVTIYFENNWKWTNINVYYWYGSNNNSWPGTSVGEAIGKNGSGEHDVYAITIPKYIDGFIINGKDNGVSKQTADIKSGWANCVCYYMDWTQAQGEHVDTYELHKNTTVTTDPTCFEAGSKVTTCSVCGKSSAEELAPVHTEIVHVEAKKNSCTEDGNLEYWYCIDCGYAYLDAECTQNTNLQAVTLPATGHSIVADKAVAPTCTATGLTAGEHCEKCDYKVAQNVVPATGHTAGAAADCENAQTCTVCGAELVKALGHNIVADAAKDATCTETGLTAGEHCTRCDYKVAQNVVPAKGHTAGAAADCENAQTCTVCGKELVAALGHKYESVVTAPTFGAQGYTTHTCSNCGHSYVDSYVAAKIPTGKFSYRGYVNDSSDREGIAFDLENVGAGQYVVIKVYDANGNLLTTTTLKAGGVEAANYTCNIVLWGRASGSWDTVISAEKLTVANIPATAELWCDGVLVDTYENALGAGTNVDQVPNYYALECVYKEAKIDNTYYATLQAAFDAAVSGDTIVLLSDVSASKYIDIYTANNGEIARTLVLDLNGKTISPAAGYNYNSGYPLLFVGINQTLTIKGEGTITADKKVTVGVYGTLTVEGGNIVNNGNGEEDAALAIYYWNHDLPSYEGIVGGTGYVKGGNFVGEVYCDAPDEDGKAVLEISGGKFTTDVSDYCADGFDCTENEDGSFGIIDHVHSYNETVTAPTFDAQGYTTYTCACGDSYVDNYVPALVAAAQIGETKYASFSEAIAAAQNGETITLLANITDSAKITIAGKSITIDLAGYVISGSCNAGQASLIYVENNAELTVKDSIGTGKITYAQGTSNVGWTIDVKGKLVLESGTIELTGSWNIGYAVDLRPNSWGSEYTNPSVFVMNGGKILSSDGGVRVASSSAPEHKKVAASFVMNGGSIDAEWDGVFIQQSDAIYDDLSFTINGGTIESDLNPVRVYGPAPTSYVNDSNCMSITLAGGTMTYTGTATYAWIIEGILRVGGGSSVETIADNGSLVVSAAIAQSAAAPEGYEWKADENGNYALTVKSVPVKIGDKAYETLAEALAEAKNGDVIVLGTDITYDGLVYMTADVVIDLNGNTLTADGFASFSTDSGIIDSGIGTGALVIPRGRIMANYVENSSVMPFWSDDVNGYIFLEMKSQAKDVVEKDADSFVVEFRPGFVNPDFGVEDRQQLLGNGALDNDLTFVIRINFISGGSVAQSIEVEISDELVGSVYANNKAFKVTVNGATDAFDSYEVVSIVKSNTGLSFSGVVGTFVPKSSDEE